MGKNGEILESGGGGEIKEKGRVGKVEKVIKSRLG